MFENHEDDNESKLDLFNLRKKTDDLNGFPWHFKMSNPKLELNSSGEKRIFIEHPSRKTAIFVVHGIGMQQRTDTAVELRSGLENVQRKFSKEKLKDKNAYLMPPFMHEGYWGNYAELEETFPVDWEYFNPESQKFFKNLWYKRAFGNLRTIKWLIKQQLRLISPRKLVKDKAGITKTLYTSKMNEFNWVSTILFLIIQIPLLITWLFALVKSPKIISGFLNDLRLYLEPKGVTEHAIAQRIEFRVRKRFLHMLELDWDFNQIYEADKQLKASGENVDFDRIVWVSHSLGTVISYNVLSDLLHRANEITEKAKGEPEKYMNQLQGVKKFKRSFKKFITMGSPLDKIANLFPNRLTPWPEIDDKYFEDEYEDDNNVDWWVNFYHAWDPVSGHLEDDYICANKCPDNHHVKIWHIPGMAHVAYWNDVIPLKYILSRTFGSNILIDKLPPKISTLINKIMAMTFNGLVTAASIAIVFYSSKIVIDLYGEKISTVINSVKEIMTSFI